MEKGENVRISLVICDAKLSNSMKCRKGVFALFCRLLFGSVKYLLMKTTDRISRENTALWYLLIDLCNKRNVTIIITDRIGIPINQLIRMEVEKRQHDKAAHATYSNYIEKMFADLVDEEEREYAKKITCWERAIHGYHLSEKASEKRLSK